ncbi:MAG: energy transducer TonB [Flavobacteriaceae bacterium]|nr:energy transducer TonB [Flavobacteriaceae bacterium]
MKNSQNQNSPNVQKDDVQHKSPAIFIQLGLVFSLLMVYLAIEAKTAVKAENFASTPIILVDDEDDIPEVPIDQPNAPKPQPEPDLSTLVVVKNDKPIVESVVKANDDSPGEKLNLDKRLDAIPEARTHEEITADFNKVEIVPAFPGCKGSNEELKKCFSQKVNDLVNDKFDVSVSEGLELSGRQRISVQFVVDQVGNIVDVKVRAPHKRLEKEAQRVIELLPQMTPGQQQKNPVRVKYNLPIVFDIQD